jgi:deoxycytidine triphosphate deaminase
LHSHRPITIVAGQRVLQIVFYELDEEAKTPYHGKYKGQTGPTKAK